DRALQAKELPLDREPARVPADAPAGRDHAMAGDDDRDGVVAERLPDRSAPARVPDTARDLAVGHHLARRHARGGHEHAELAGCGVAEVEAHVEAPPFAR